MRIIPILAVAVLIGCCCIVLSDESTAPGSEGPEYVRTCGETNLYRINLNDGPLYYYEYPDGKIRVVAFTSFTMNITVSV